MEHWHLHSAFALVALISQPLPTVARALKVPEQVHRTRRPAWAKCLPIRRPATKAGRFFGFWGGLSAVRPARQTCRARFFKKKYPGRISAPGLLVVATSRGQRFGPFLHLGGGILRCFL